MPRFSGVAWFVLQRLASGARPPSSAPTATVATGVLDEVVAAVDSVLPHYGVARLRTILAQPSFVGQNAEMVIQRLLEGDEGAAVPASPAEEARASTSHLAPAVEAPAPEVGRSLVKSRANVFGAFDFDASTIAASKTARTARVDELTPSLKRRFWRVPRRSRRTRTRSGIRLRPRRAPWVWKTSSTSMRMDAKRAPRQTTKTMQKQGCGSGCCCATTSSRGLRLSARMPRLDGVQRGRSLRDATGWSDDLLESWAVMLDRNPRKDRLLAAASQAQLDDHLATVNAAREEKLFGPDKGRGGECQRPILKRPRQARVHRSRRPRNAQPNTRRNRATKRVDKATTRRWRASTRRLTPRSWAIQNNMLCISSIVVRREWGDGGIL